MGNAAFSFDTPAVELAEAPEFFVDGLSHVQVIGNSIRLVFFVVSATGDGREVPLKLRFPIDQVPPAVRLTLAAVERQFH